MTRPLQPAAKVFGLSTTPLAEIRSEVQEAINRAMLAIVYNQKGSAPAFLLAVVVAFALLWGCAHLAALQIDAYLTRVGV